MKPIKMLRADELLVQQGLVETRNKAQALILAGQVRLSPDDVIDKPSRKIPADATPIITHRSRFVSRGGEKLEAFLQYFHIDVRNETALDVGASTGGFTDCLLQNGAKSVTCIDVGHGQLHYKLQQDPHVTSFENVNAKDLSADFFHGQLFDNVVCDVSFISLKKVLPIIWQFAQNRLIALIKPQFEADKKTMDQCRGVIRDASLQEQIRDDVISFAPKLPRSEFIGVIDSPILGTDGNREFVFGVRKI